MSVKTAQPIPSGEPHISVSISGDAGYGLLWKSIFNVVSGNCMLGLSEYRKAE